MCNFLGKYLPTPEVKTGTKQTVEMLQGTLPPGFFPESKSKTGSTDKCSASSLHLETELGSQGTWLKP